MGGRTVRRRGGVMLLDRARLVPLQSQSRGRVARFEGSLCLVGSDPTRVASAALFDACRTHRGTGAELIEKVAAMVQRAGGAALPAFAIVAQDGDALLVAVHGPVYVMARQLAGLLELGGGGSGTWVTGRVQDVAALNATLVEGAPLSVPALVDLQRGVAVGDGFALLAEGVAPGDLGSAETPLEVPAEGPEPLGVTGPDDVRVAVQPNDGSAAVLWPADVGALDSSEPGGGDSARGAINLGGALAPGERGSSDAEQVVPPLALSPEAIRLVLSADGPPPSSPVPPEDDRAVPSRTANPEQVAAPGPVAVPAVRPAGPSPADQGSSSDRPGAAPQPAPDPGAAVLRGDPGPGRAPGPPPAIAAPSPPLGFASLPGGAFKIVELRPTAAVPLAAPLPVAQPKAANDPPELPTGAVRVRGVHCGRGHFNDPRARFCAVCGLAMFQTSVIMQDGARPPLGVLLLSNGESFPLSTNLVLGREPGVHPAVVSGEADAVIPSSMGPSLSRIHAQVRLEGWDVVLIDEGSTNGTFVWDDARRQWNRLVSHQPHVLRPGDQLAFGALTATFETSLQQ